MRAKVDTYLAFGVGSMRVVELERETADIYEESQRRTLSGGDPVESRFVPGFRVSVAELLARR